MCRVYGVGFRALGLGVPLGCPDGFLKVSLWL